MRHFAYTRERRKTFDAIAALYDEVRPGYPPVLFMDLARVCRLGPDSHILEIGCGTGQATSMFAEDGFRLTGLEPSAAMAAIARTKVPSGAAIEIIEREFERADMPSARFDLVFAAQSFHWIDAALGYSQAHRVLREGGHLALVWTLKKPLAEPLQTAFGQLYRRHYRKEPWFCMELDCLRRAKAERRMHIESHGYFSIAREMTYTWSQTYATGGYLSLLDSYTDHQQLPDARRQALYEGLGEAIELAGGSIDITYETTAYLCSRNRRVSI